MMLEGLLVLGGLKSDLNKMNNTIVRRYGNELLMTFTR